MLRQLEWQWNRHCDSNCGFYLFRICRGPGIQRYNVFINPFSEPREMSEFIRQTIIFKNRLYLMVASALCLLDGMFNLQFREKFV
ncbi:hypothetical protein JKA74_19975 [Marivirga sp. S37H4]|uniref:Uncharacterized protein n=1 Tax=Marivirga aurantiaca TaxID=2802615 RepID=A0A934X308_9BACT|nr:hypothetical protein [Marivirga aurantiaca]MBK6267331.1 hypothetical protein [Marivirga aurantiaca]